MEVAARRLLERNAEGVAVKLSAFGNIAIDRSKTRNK